MSNSNVILSPFSAIPIPQYLRNELKRRKDSYGNNYKPFSNINEYRGAMSSWIRVVSNAIYKDRKGFVLYGGQGFKDGYGIKNDNNSNVIGYDRLGKAHYLNNSDAHQKYRPIPGIEGVEVDIRKDVYRAAFIKWKCYSVGQLNYMSEFMFTPYNTVTLEWGWNTFNQASLINTNDIGKPAEYDDKDIYKLNTTGSGMLGAYTNPALIEDALKKSEGKYDGMIGHIINFDYTYNPSDLCFNCTTEIASNSKFYFGLSFDGVVGKLNENETQTKKTLKELFGEDIKQNIQSASKTLNGLILNKTQTKGRIFSPKEFRTHRKVTQGQIQDANVVYITFGLLVDIINDVIRVEHAEGRSEQFSIQVDGVKIGAHPNIISCNKKFLIPNAMAPYFSPESLSDSPERTTQPKNKLTESPLFESSKLNKTDSADKLMDMVLNNKKRRQNLSEALNYLNEDGWWNHSFPSLESVPNSLYYGYLSDIFLDYSSIEEKIIRSKSIKDFFTTLCQELNSEIRIWNIEFVSGTKQNTWTFRDSKFLDIDRLKAIKKEFGIIHDGDLIYNLDVFTQESVIKELSFGVKLSDSVANMVLHQANSQLATDGGNVTTTNQKFFINPVSDYLLEKLATNKTGGNSTSLTGKELNPSNYNQLPQSQKDAVDAKRENYLKALSEKATKERSFMKNIDDNVILFEEQINGQPRKTLRLNLPPDQKSKLLHMLEDEEQPLFTNLNSMPIPGVKVEFTLLGVAGFRTFQVFKVSNLPKPYDKGALFQITEIKHSITTDGWNTRIVANVRPIKSIETLIK